MGIAQITDVNTRAKDLAEDGGVDITILNNSSLDFGHGDFVVIDLAKIGDAATDVVAKELINYFTSSTTAGAKAENGFTLETIVSGDRGKVRIKGIHTSAYVATGSTTLAEGLPVGHDSTDAKSGTNKAAYSSNQGVGTSASLVAAYVISATSKIVLVV